MTRAELIRMFVLNGICDDYEGIEQITKYIDELGPKCGLTIKHEDIVQALRELIELGYATAWDLTQRGNYVTGEYQGMPPREEITPSDPRFVRTEEGLAFHQVSSASRPIDENANFRESWLAPASLRHEELVRLFVLDSFRNFTHVRVGHIERYWNDLAGPYGITLSRDEIIQALGELVSLGYMRASYKGRDCRQYDAMPPLEDIKPFGAYFWVTGKGWDLNITAESWWPFDDDDGEWRLREDWVPPSV